MFLFVYGLLPVSLEVSFSKYQRVLRQRLKNWDSDFGFAIIKKASRFIRVKTHVQFRKLPLWDSSKHDAELD